MRTTWMTRISHTHTAAWILGPAAGVMHNFWKKWRLGHYLAISRARLIWQHLKRQCHGFGPRTNNASVCTRGSQYTLRQNLVGSCWHWIAAWTATVSTPDTVADYFIFTRLIAFFLRASCCHRQIYRQSAWRDKKLIFIHPAPRVSFCHSTCIVMHSTYIYI